MTVRFSILIPAFNREKYVGQAINSVLSQSFPNYESVVIDDGSTDKTLQVLESYGARIKVLRQPNQGPEVARNRAAALAQGEYLVLLDSDDLLLPNALATYDRIIREFDSPPLIIGAMADFEDGEGIPRPQCSTPIKVLKYRDYLSKDIKVGLSSSRIVLKKATFHEVGGLRNTTSATFHLDSLNLILKVGTYGPCIIVCQPSTVAYRHHEANAIRSLDAIAQGILVLARSERCGQYPGGSKRRRDRYACIGAIALSWAVSYCLLRGRRWRLAFRLLIGTLPMALVAVWKKVLTLLRRPTQAIVLSERGLDEFDNGIAVGEIERVVVCEPNPRS
jgi:glycosyltransferase involved in cell wall biosynthesis